MSFRLRVTALAAAAVALAVIGSATLMYAEVERRLVGEVDQSLVAAVDFARAVPRGAGPRIFERLTAISGRADVHGQVIDAAGNVLRADVTPIPGLITSNARAVAARQRTEDWSIVEFQGTRIRVHAAPFANAQAIVVARPLDEVDSVLADTRRTLLIVGLGGIVLAAGLGALVARAALGPIRRLNLTVEEVARTRDLSRRVAATSNDELGRLAGSFDGMLAALESSVRSQRQLVADASHELRTPLTSLRTNLELLARGQPTDEADRRHLLTDLVSQIERLTTLVSDLIDLARDEDAPLPVESVQLDAVVATAIKDVGSRYTQVEFTLQAAPSTVQGVHSRIARAITNLLDNAAKWSPPGGTIEVTVFGGEVTVRDHGPGIAPADRARVFDRFWRAPNAHHLPGSGLGLAIVRDVAEFHGGSIAVEEPSGGGTRFRLRLRGAAS